MTDLTDLLPLLRETPDTIKARLLAGVNAGIDPADPMYLDTLPGSFWDDMMGAVSIEFDRVYDRAATEVPAAALPTSATGEWLDAWAEALGRERKGATSAAGFVEFTAADGTAIPTGTQVSTVQTTPDADPTVFETTEAGVVAGGTALLPVRAINEGAQGNVAANTVTVLASSLDNATVVTNPNGITGGSDIETDEALARRVGDRLAGASGAGNVDFYTAEALAEPGVGYATVFPNTPALGEVTISITDINNDPAPPTISDSLQARLDPSATPAQGAGEAPPGATVHVQTPAATNVTVDAVLDLEDGYTIDGTGGTKAAGPGVSASVASYVNSLPAGGDPILTKVIAAIVDAEGVADTSGVEINGAAANLAIDAAHVASLVAVNLT